MVRDFNISPFIFLFITWWIFPIYIFSFDFISEIFAFILFFSIVFDYYFCYRYSIYIFGHTFNFSIGFSFFFWFFKYVFFLIALSLLFPFFLVVVKTPVLISLHQWFFKNTLIIILLLLLYYYQFYSTSFCNLPFTQAGNMGTSFHFILTAFSSFFFLHQQVQ